MKQWNKYSGSAHYDLARRHSAVSGGCPDDVQAAPGLVELHAVNGEVLLTGLSCSAGGVVYACEICLFVEVDILSRNAFGVCSDDVRSLEGVKGVKRNV